MSLLRTQVAASDLQQVPYDVRVWADGLPLLSWRSPPSSGRDRHTSSADLRDSADCRTGRTRPPACPALRQLNTRFPLPRVGAYAGLAT